MRISFVCRLTRVHLGMIQSFQIKIYVGESIREKMRGTDVFLESYLELTFRVSICSVGKKIGLHYYTHIARI